MSAFDTLSAIARGEAVTDIAAACRLEQGSVEAFGSEAIRAAFRASPMVFDADSLRVEGRGTIAVFANRGALFADLYGDVVGRLWRIGGDAFGLHEPGVSVAFDPDLAQTCGDVAFRASDHPELDGDAVERVLAGGREVVGAIPAFRARAFVVRAFGSADCGAALYAVHRLAPDAVRSGGFSHAAAFWSEDSIEVVRDPGGERPASELRVRLVDALR